MASFYFPITCAQTMSPKAPLARATSGLSKYS